MAPIIKTLIIVLSPICYPISKGLDYFLGEHDEKVRFAKKDLKTLMDLHDNRNHQNDEAFSTEEIRIIKSTMDIRHVNVEKIMVKFDKIFKVHTNTKITPELLKRLKKRSYSKIPIFDEENLCIGVLVVKKLVHSEEILGKYIKDIKASNAITSVAKNTNLLEALRIMQEKKLSTVMVVDEQRQKRKSIQLRSRNDMLVDNNRTQILGFVFLKDIFEEIIKAEIEDQDYHFDSTLPQNNARVNRDQVRDTDTGGIELREAKEEPLLRS